MKVFPAQLLCRARIFFVFFIVTAAVAGERIKTLIAAAEIPTYNKKLLVDDVEGYLPILFKLTDGNFVSCKDFSLSNGYFYEVLVKKDKDDQLYHLPGEQLIFRRNGANFGAKLIDVHFYADPTTVSLEKVVVITYTKTHDKNTIEQSVEECDFNKNIRIGLPRF